MSAKIAILPGDGVGPEIVAEAVKVIDCLREAYGLVRARKAEIAEEEAQAIGGTGWEP